MTAEELRPHLPTVDVIARDLYSIEFQSGKARCAFPERHHHGDRDHSLRFDRAKNRIFCASQQCFGESGADAIELVKVLGRCDFPRALQVLADRYVANHSNGNAKHRNGNSAPDRPILASVLRQRKLQEGFDVVAAEYGFGDRLRKVRLEHRDKRQAEKGRPEKTFLWEHRGHDGEWYSGDGGFQKPLYINPIFADRDQPGLAVGFEGEGKADLAAQFGLAAFSHKVISTEAAATLTDWDVVLWPDADKPGEQAAKKAVELITKAGARSVVIAPPPAGLPAGGDIVDAVERLNWGATEIERFIGAVRASIKQRILRVEDVPRIESVSGSPICWAVDGLIPMSAITLVSGESGVGKSSVVSVAAREISRREGGMFAGRRCTFHPVLILDVENGQPPTLERFERFGIYTHDDLRVWGQWLEEEPPGADSPLIRDWVARCEPKPVIVWDSFIGFHPGDENDSSQTRRYMAPYRRLAGMGAGIVLIHHSGKAESAKDYRGSSDIKASIDIGLKLSDLGDGTGLSVLELRAFKQRFATVSRLVLRYQNGDFSADECERVKTVTERLVDLLRANPEVTSGDFEALAADRDLGRNRAREFLRVGVERGKIGVTPGNKGARLHRWQGGLDGDFLAGGSHD